MFSSRPVIKEVQHELSCYENVKLNKSNICTCLPMLFLFLQGLRRHFLNPHFTIISSACTMFTRLYVYFKCYGYHVPCFTATSVSKLLQLLQTTGEFS